MAAFIRVDSAQVREIREITQLSQQKFARLLQVDVGTLRNWEQGRREPTGPAKALLRAIKNNPQAVLKALAE
jgi:putative transcriptional regulator